MKTTLSFGMVPPTHPSLGHQSLPMITETAIITESENPSVARHTQWSMMSHAVAHSDDELVYDMEWLPKNWIVV